MMKKQCNGDEHECAKCGMYYSSHSAHWEKVKGQLKEVITISCCYGTGGVFDAETRERLETYY